jgi:chromosomal replication initiation ATPase DnaA
MAQSEIAKAQRKANSYKSPATFMDGFNYGLEVSDKIPSTNAQIELQRIKQQNEYIMQQNIILLQKLKNANDRIDTLDRIFGAKSAELLTISDICDAVCAYFYIDKHRLKEVNRSKEISIPRQIVSYIAQVYGTAITTTMLANYFNQDHTTHVHARHRMENLYGKDKQITSAIDAVCAILFTQKETT